MGKKKADSGELLKLYGYANKLYGFLEAVALAQDDDAAQGCCETALYANNIAHHFREQLKAMMPDAKE